LNQIFTVGHSTQPLESFIALLKRHRIEVIADVRSRPYSARFPHFSKEALQHSLKNAGVRYVFLGRELGARREERECYINGQAVYMRIAQLRTFAEGINRVLTGALSFRVALMCAEQDPLTCHRTILVCHQIKHHGVSIQHIGRSGALEAHEQAERRLVAEEIGRLDQGDMFDGRCEFAQILETAYAQRAQHIAYTEAKPADDHSHDRIHTEIR
jgi:uncharacterized protein (DUF488 family)